MRVQVTVDGQSALRRHARAVLVGNVGRLQGGVVLLPDAEPDNGRMDVAILAPRTLAHWAALAFAVLLRRQRVPRMEVIRGSRITISSDREQPRELDGDVIAAARTLQVTVRPSALWLCVPQPDSSADLAEGS
jgi:diacylglycerol kinase family enzyme